MKPRAYVLHTVLMSKRSAVHKTAKRPSRQRMNVQLKKEL